MSRDALKEQLERIIFDSVEGPKIDYKRDLSYKSTVEKVEFAKDVSLILNTDDPTNFQDVGYIVFGAELGKITGAHNTLVNSDKLQNELESALRSYIIPAARLSVVCYTTETGEPWGAVVLAPSREQPHVFIKELSGNPARGDWYVRNGASKDKAAPHDYDRIKRKLVARTVEPLQNQISALMVRLSGLEERYDSALFNFVTRAAGGTTKEAGEADSAVYALGNASGLDLAARLRQRLRGPHDQLATDIVHEAVELRAFLESASGELPWNLRSQDAAACRQAIELLEQKSVSLLEAVAVVVQYDETEKLYEAVQKATAVLANDISAPPGVSITSAGEEMRAYPLVLLMQLISMLSITYKRTKLLRIILDTPFRDRVRNLPPAPIAYVVGRFRIVSDLFAVGVSGRSCEPISQRVYNIMLQMLSDSYITEDFVDAFYLGEFVISLAAIEGSEEAELSEYPVPGLYLYASQAKSVLSALLVAPPKWFTDFYQISLTEILYTFDQRAPEMTNQRCFPQGLYLEGVLE